ncbi:MAG: hypothetical protein R8G66_33780 [Cytophagales bacterium]|nr:hypothetical protein [Cytophagales bacterium]
MPNLSIAQDQEPVAPVTLDEKFNALKTTSETYEQFKVITTTRMDDFWKEVQDSLRFQQEASVRLLTEVTERKLETEQLQSKMDGISAELEKAQSNTTTISFLGADIQKSTYHLVVWGIIVILLILCVIIWWTGKSGSSTAKQAREDYETISTELENTKNKAREAQIKLKRELQTALNQIEELKRRSNS